MSKMRQLNNEQQTLRDELYFIENSDEEEDIERTEEINERLRVICDTSVGTVRFLYPILEEEKMIRAGRVAEADWIKKNPLADALARVKHSDKRIEMLERAILFNLENFNLHDVNLPDGSTINKKLNPGRLVIDETQIDYNALPDELVMVVPEHKELLPPDKYMDYPGAAALIKKELTSVIKDEKGRLDQVTSVVMLDELPGFALVRDVVIQVK